MSHLATIDRVELSRRLEARDDGLVLVDALAPMSFARGRLPGAINIQPGWVDERARHKLPDLGAEIVVYCANPECTSSVEVAERLLELGYRHVRHYPGGKEDWVAAGLPLEGGH
jgi:rhodanese-related sulfurtransferase